MAEQAWIGLGSNLGDRMGFLRAGIREMARAGIKVEELSAVYETDPVGPPQPDYLNAVAKVTTDLAPRDLLATLKTIERLAGRTDGVRWGPRQLDLDLLAYSDRLIDEPGLTLPHPELTSRPFVMIPLLAIDPSFELPSGEPLANFCEPESPGVRLYGRLEAAAG